MISDTRERLPNPTTCGIGQKALKFTLDKMTASVRLQHGFLATELVKTYLNHQA